MLRNFLLLFVFAWLCAAGHFQTLAPKSSVTASDPQEAMNPTNSNNTHSNTSENGITQGDGDNSGDDLEESEEGFPAQDYDNSLNQTSLDAGNRTTETGTPSLTTLETNHTSGSSYTSPNMSATTPVSPRSSSITTGLRQQDMLSKDLAKHKPGDTHGDSRHRAGVVILIFIIIGIMMLIGTLYFLRKKGRSYSFDLAHPSDHETPLRSMEQEGTFEQTNKETPVSLDYEQEDKVNHTDNSVVNGVAAELSEKTPDDKIDSSSEEQNVAEENSFSSESSLTTPIKKVEFNLDLDLGSDKSSVTTPTTTESQDGQHNENNNNVTLIATTAADTGENTFTEISLDEQD